VNRPRIREQGGERAAGERDLCPSSRSKTVARRIPPSEFITKLNPKRFMEGWVLAPLALGKEKRSRTRYSTRRSAQALATTQISRKARAL